MSKISQEEMIQDGKDFLSIGASEEVAPENEAMTVEYDGSFTGMPRREITIFNQDGPSGDQSVFVAVNGRGFSIPREKPTLVPEAIIRALENAVETKYYREVDEQGREFGAIKERHVRRYNFTVK